MKCPPGGSTVSRKGPGPEPTSELWMAMPTASRPVQIQVADAEKGDMRASQKKLLASEHPDPARRGTSTDEAPSTHRALIGCLPVCYFVTTILGEKRCHHHHHRHHFVTEETGWKSSRGLPWVTWPAQGHMAAVWRTPGPQPPGMHLPRLHGWLQALTRGRTCASSQALPSRADVATLQFLVSIL